MAPARDRGPGATADLTTPALEFAEEVYASPRVTTRALTFADEVYGREEGVPYHSPDQIRRHWGAEWRRRTGYGDAGDRDNVILVTARRGKGEGKSALAQDIGELVGHPIPIDRFAEHVTFRARRFLEIINTLSRGEVGIYDDAGEGLLSTEFWSEESRILTKAIAIARDVHATLILCIPAVTMFSPAFMRALVDYWIQVQLRGSAKVHPKPGERYTKAKGIGWYPDAEWNPLVWPRPERARWGVYSRFRRESRISELVRFQGELDREHHHGAQTGDLACASCGLAFSRKDALDRHQKASCPGSSGRQAT